MKTTLKPHKRFSVRAGFSLVELLVVIAVIGVIAAIAIPNIGSITGQAGEAAAKRNAQNIASVASSAVAAGWTMPAKALALGAITTSPGVTGSGSFEDTNFSSPMSSGDAQDASEYLSETLEYVPGGGQQETAPTAPSA